MPLPTYQEMYLPMLYCLADGREMRTQECSEALADQFHLTTSERNQLLESGRQTVLNNRCGWAATYLAKSGLVVRPKRGVLKITDRGLAAISAADAGAAINNAYLRQFPEFISFQSSDRKTHQSTSQAKSDSVVLEQTPQEAMESGYNALRTALAGDLLERIKEGSPKFFERLVLDLLVAMGYGGSRADAAQAVGGSGDGGVDGIIKEDKLGLDSIYLQAKRWESAVGRPVVQGFAGSLEGHRARKGVFITTSRFSQDARDYVRFIEKRIVLIDGERLANLMIDHGVGVADVAIFAVKRIDEDYFEEA